MYCCRGRSGIRSGSRPGSAHGRSAACASTTSKHSGRAAGRCCAWTACASATAPTRCRRSEEHTSELQSLMRISYAVFCLKKKKKTTQKHHQLLYIETQTYKSTNYQHTT